MADIGHKVGDKDRYWAAMPVEEAVREMDTRIEQFYQHIRTARVIELWRAAHWACYAGQRTGGNLGIAGEAAELTTIEINSYGNLKQHVLNLVTGQRPSFESKANNTDHASQTQTLLANSLIETVMRERGLEQAVQLVADYSVMYGEGFLACLWDANAGVDFRPNPEGGILKTGDVVFHPLMPTEVVRDVMRDNNRNLDWIAIRLWHNRFDLMARYPELAKDIADVPSKYETEDKRPRIVSRQWTQVTGLAQNDEIPGWLFFHRKSDALPDGRFTHFLTPDIVIYDGALPYHELPVYRMAASDVHGTVWGYTSLHDLLAPQIALNATISTIVSNQAALGVQNVWVPAGANLSWKEIKGGLNMIEGGVQPPQPLQLLATSPETFKLLDLLERAMETLSGVNSVARGNPESSLKSGAALALVQAQAVQFVTLLQKAYITFLERVATGTMRLYRQFATVPHLITITGQANREYTREFTSADIEDVDRVTVQATNPLMSTIAGRYNLAEMMVVNGLVRDPAQLDMVLTTGRLEPIYQGPVKERLNISAENERLSNGQPVTAAMTDNHPLHIQENSTVLDSPEARENPEVVRAVTEHLLEHQQLWQSAPPAILISKGIPLPPPPVNAAMMGMMLPQGPQQGPPQQGKGVAPKPGMKGPGVPPGVQPGAPGAFSTGLKQPQMPRQPRSPLNGQPASGPPQPPAPGQSVT